MPKKADKWTSFRLDEISVVTRGAQPGADIHIEKSGDDSPDVEKNDLVDLFTSTEMGHNHGVRVAVENQSLNFYVFFSEMATNTGQDTRHDHQVIRTDDGNFMLSEQFGHSHTISQADVETALMRAINKGAELPEGIEVADLLAGFTSSDKTGETSMTEAERKALEEKVATAEAENKSLKAVSALPADQKAYYDSLDDTAKAAFLEKSDADKATEVKAADAKNDVVYTTAEGKEYKRGDVTDAELELLKRMDALESENAELKAERAEDNAKAQVKELAHLPGTDAEKLETIKAINAIPDATQREKAFNALKSSGASTSMFVKTGLSTDGEDLVAKSDGDATGSAFDALVKQAMDADPKLSRAKATAQVVKTHPELAEAAIAG